MVNFALSKKMDAYYIAIILINRIINSYNYKLHAQSKNYAYTPSVKKTRHHTLGHNFTNYYPIFKFFSLADSVVNLQQIDV